MTSQVFTATEKTTGRTWIYQTRHTYGRQEFRFPMFKGQWSPNLKLAKDMAKQAGRFRYDDEPALVVIVD